MIRQNANRNSLERIPFFYGSVDLAQAIDMTHEEITAAVGKRNREEKDAALDPGATVARHAEHHGGQKRATSCASCLPSGAFAHPTKMPTVCVSARRIQSLRLDTGAASGEVRNLISAAVAPASFGAGATPSEKTVTSWISAGSGPTSSAPA